MAPAQSRPCGQSEYPPLRDSYAPSRYRRFPASSRSITLGRPSSETLMTEKSATLDRPAACTVLRAGVPIIGKQGFSYAPAISAETVGASAIHMQLLTIPPGGRAKAHKHEAHETAIYILSGQGAMYYGDQLESHLIARPGDFVYIPADVPHLP